MGVRKEFNELQSRLSDLGAYVKRAEDQLLRTSQALGPKLPKIERYEREEGYEAAIERARQAGFREAVTRGGAAVLTLDGVSMTERGWMIRLIPACGCKHVVEMFSDGAVTVTLPGQLPTSHRIESFDWPKIWKGAGCGHA